MKKENFFIYTSISTAQKYPSLYSIMIMIMIMISIVYRDLSRVENPSFPV